MKKFSFIILLCLIALQFTGCGTNPNRTQRGNLLDDKVTSQRVRSALKRAGPDFRQINVTTSNGTVTLSGMVRSEQQRERAEQIGRGVHRVSDLKNDVQVRQ